MRIILGWCQLPYFFLFNAFLQPTLAQRAHSPQLKVWGIKMELSYKIRSLNTIVIRIEEPPEITEPNTQSGR